MTENVLLRESSVERVRIDIARTGRKGVDHIRAVQPLDQGAVANRKFLESPILVSKDRSTGSPLQHIRAGRVAVRLVASRWIADDRRGHTLAR